MKRHVPVRTCAGCRTARPKRELVRIVRTPAGEVAFDPTGKRSGRGAYVCPREACVESALRSGSLERVLGPLPDELARLLREQVAGGEAKGV